MVDSTAPASSSTTTPVRYSTTARTLHWITVLALLAQVPIGLWMASRGAAGVFDDLTNTLYSWHKLIGFTLLWIILLRVVIAARGWPPYPSSLAPMQQMAAHALHRLMYVLLVAIPLLGWAGVTAFPALVTLGGYNLPPMPFIPQSDALAGTIFTIHKWAAYTLLFLLVGHIGAALMHLVVFRDGIFQRMWGK